jgi:hypothetical protein
MINSQPSTLPIFFVTDVLQPLHDFAVQLFLNGDVRHRDRRGGAVPMLLVRRKPDYIAGAGFLQLVHPHAAQSSTPERSV